jgi:glycyl-tRNA synthetase beta chain
MPALLFEIYSEEIPSEMQDFSTSKLFNNMLEKLHKLFQKEFEGQYFFTPKRIGFHILDIPKIVDSTSSEIRGPKITASEKAIEGFLKKYNIKNTSNLIEKDGYYHYNEISEKKCIKEIIKIALEEIIATFVWPKSMRWGRYDIKWIRPIHSILCLFDKEVIPVNFGHITAGNQTYGKNKVINIDSFATYTQKLEEFGIHIFQEKRLEIIKTQAISICKSLNISIINDDELIKEVANLVESPHVTIGKIEERFMKLPKEILVSMLKFHQKYLMTQDKNGNLAPYFIIVSNVMTDDNLKTVIAGNEKVLRSRLSDAQYFYDQDLKTNLIDKFEKLKKVTFHHEIGSYYDKIKMVKKVALDIAKQIKINNKDRIERTSLLIKADLVTEIVNELPELQGIAGYYYALNDNEGTDVANAIKEHYLPQGPSDKVPKEALSIIMALADKIVTLNSMFEINIKPTGSKDPYALRRAAIGIIRIVCSNELEIKLNHLINKDVVDFIKERIEILSSKDKNIYSIDLQYINNSL